MLVGASVFLPFLAFYPKYGEVKTFHDETPEISLYLGFSPHTMVAGWRRMGSLNRSIYVFRYERYTGNLGVGGGIVAETNLNFFGLDATLSYRGKASFLQVSPRLSLTYFPTVKYPGYVKPVDRIVKNFVSLTFGVDLGITARVEVER